MTIKMFSNDGKIHNADDLEIFKKLKGNRHVEWPRVKKIMASIERVGYIPVPIVVNENMEIIDGQGRVEACAKLGLPVPYTVVEGAGLDECIAMNISGTKWGKLDYIESFAERGNENYIRLLELAKKHDVTIGVVIAAALGKLTTSKDGIESGLMVLSEERAAQAEELLTYLDRFVSFVKDKNIPNMKKIYEALCFLYYIQAVDNERMYRAFTMYYADLGGYSTTEQALDSLESIYNKKLAKHNKVFVASEYQAYMANRLPWYEARHGRQ